LALAALSYLPLAETLENQVLDLYQRSRPHVAPPADLLIIGVDEPSFQEVGHPWPWPRRVHAGLVDRLAAAGARLIVFDIIFTGPSTAEDDRLFAGAIARAGNVILAQGLEVAEDPQFSRQVLVQPLESLRRGALGVALSMVTPDHDGVVRRFRLRLGGQETLPAAVVRNLGKDLLPPDGLSGFIHYVGPPRSIDTVSYYQAVDPERPLPGARIRDRIVFIGRMLEVSATPQAQADSFYTPFFGGSGQLMSGVEIQGNIVHTLLGGFWGWEPPKVQRLLGYGVLLLLAGLLLARFSPLRGLLVLAGLTVLLGGASFCLFLAWGLWAPPVLLTMGLALSYTGNVVIQYLLESREKRWLRQAFGSYVSPEVVEIITAHPEQLALGGVEVEVTVLFTDLEGFSGLSERMAPPDLIRILNEYFTPMTRIVMNGQGTVDKFIGDSLMALWGAPVAMADHAARACRAALEMRQEMQLLRQSWQARGLPRLAARVGLHSGSAIAGNVGSHERFNYTVLGDTVNLAARLEGVNKYYGTDILLSEDTYRQVADAFLVRELDQVQVKGRSQPVTVYELLDLASEEGLPPWLQLFSQARRAYLQGQWLQASDLFKEVTRLQPQDLASQLYLQRCLDYLKEPPPPDWRGVVVLANK
jgi:adenylate cyclase